MKAHECYHCRQWIEAGQAHDCWTTTEAALTLELSEDLRDAWERLRETLAGLGEQRIYASHNSIMFARTACYAFVRPKRKFLEVYFFLGRTVRSAPVRRSTASSKVKIAHEARVIHRDQVEPPLTDWLREAYDQSEALTARGRIARKANGPAKSGRKAKSQARPKAAKSKTAKAAPRQKTPRTRSRARGRSARR
jgi:hypothetical protein